MTTKPFREDDSDPVVSETKPVKGERLISIPLSQLCHFDTQAICWLAHKAGITSQWIAYRVAGHEYRKGQYCTYPCLLLAVLPIKTPEDALPGWSWISC